MLVSAWKIIQFCFFYRPNQTMRSCWVPQFGWMDGQILISDQPVADLIHISQTLHYNLLKFQFVGWL